MQALIASNENLQHHGTTPLHDNELFTQTLSTERSRNSADSNAWRTALEPLYHVCDRLGSERTPSAIHARLLELVQTFIGSDRVTLAEVDSERSRLLSTCSTDPVHEPWAHPLGEGIIGEVARLGLPYLTARADDVPRTEREIGLRACLPINFAGDVLGVVMLYGGQELTATQMKLLHRLLGNAALALGWKH